MEKDQRIEELEARLAHVLCAKHASYTTTGCLVCNGNRKNDSLYRHNRRLLRLNKLLKAQVRRLSLGKDIEP